MKLHNQNPVVRHQACRCRGLLEVNEARGTRPEVIARPATTVDSLARTTLMPWASISVRLSRQTIHESALVYPRISSTDLDALRFFGEWHEVRRNS